MNNHSELMTIKDILRFTISQFQKSDLFYGHGTDNASDEAFALVFGILHLPHDIDPILLEGRLTTDERTAILTAIEQRISKRIPLPYLTHEAWFCGMPFYVDEHVLIPRSPIAEMIESQFAPWIEPENVKNILDLCTGSGCIAIACAKAFESAHVDASDISKAALAVARKNIVKHHVDEQVTLIESDLFENIPDKKYDIIVSNPPYVSESEMETLPLEYRHEPSQALEAGKLGLDFADKIIANANKYLSPHGILVVEVGNSEYALAEKYPHLPFTWLSFERGGGGVFILTAEQCRT